MPTVLGIFYWKCRDAGEFTPEKQWFCIEKWSYILQLKVSFAAGSIGACSCCAVLFARDPATWRSVVSASKYDEFCIKTEEFCINNEKICIKNEGFCILNDEFCRASASAAERARWVYHEWSGGCRSVVQFMMDFHWRMVNIWINNNDIYIYIYRCIRGDTGDIYDLPCAEDVSFIYKLRFWHSKRLDFRWNMMMGRTGRPLSTTTA